MLRLCSDDPFDDAQCAAPDAVSPETSAPVEVNTDAAPTGARAPVNSASNEVSAMIADLDRLFGQFKQKFDDMNKNLVDAMAPMFGPAEVAAATEEQKRAVFQGRPPSLRLLADRIRQGLCRRVVVLVGAGISTAAGIPDFRTPGLWAEAVFVTDLIWLLRGVGFACAPAFHVKCHSACVVFSLVGGRAMGVVSFHSVPLVGQS